jgi:tetratricopeptide (TPR) repeat protein
MLEGSARREAGRIRISAALVQAAAETQLWADTFERELSGILALQSDMAREVARRVDIALTPEQERRLAGSRSVNPEVYESYNYAGRHDEAIVVARRALELNPGFRPSYRVLRLAYSAKGAHQEAIAAAQRYAELDPVRGYAELCIAYAQAGHREQALAALAGIAKHAPGLTFIAAAHLALGDRNAAIAELEAAYKARTPTFPWVRVHGGDFDALRDDPASSTCCSARPSSDRPRPRRRRARRTEPGSRSAVYRAFR